jgi:hypothetical protein
MKTLIQRWLKNDLALMLWASLAAFCTYFCMYAFRKPFTAGTFEGMTVWGDKTFLQDWISRYYATTEGILMSRTFAKLREVTLAYSVPSSLLKKGFVREASISLTGRNLLYWAEFADTDVDQFNAPGFGRSNLQSPTLRRFGASINLKF